MSVFSKLAKVKIRINMMHFTDKQKDFIFDDWPNLDEHLDWLLTASREEIVSWGKAVGLERRTVIQPKPPARSRTKETKITTLKIFVIDDEGKITKEFTCITDSIPRALQMYEDEAGEFEHLEYKIVDK